MRSTRSSTAIALTNDLALRAAGGDLHAPTWHAVCAIADEARAGLVNINETTNYWENHLPFGGRAGSLSGVGRVGGRYPFDALTDLQTVVIG